MKIKVIHISHASHSYFANENDNLKKITLNDWYFKTAVQLKKFHPEIEVECWSPEKQNKDYEEYTENNVLLKFFPVTFSPMYALDFSYKMLKELKKEFEKSKKENYKLILHIHEFHNLHGLLILTLFGKEKIIVQHHGGSWPTKHLRESKGKRKILPIFFLAQLWENSIIKNIKHYYALSQSEIDYIKKRNKNVRFQTMGIDEEYFEKIKRSLARKKLGMNLNDKVILFLGRVSEIKGIDYLLEAAKKLPEVKIKIIGFGKEKNYFENLAKKNRLDNIEFLGGIFGEKKLLYLSAADALVLPSLKEGAPVTIMESLARNLSCVATDVGGVRLMIEQGKNGLIIKQRDTEEIVNAVNKILEWPEKDHSNYAKIYKWKKIINDTVKDYIK